MRPALEGANIVNKAAWVLVAPTVALTALCDPAIAQVQGEDPVRRQAEELAAEASRKFGEVLKGQVPDPAPPRRADEPGTEAGGDPTLNVLLYWLDYSEHEYRGIMRRLALEGRGSGWDPVTLSWLKRSSQQFQSIMARLARAGAPAGKWDPVADADKRRLEGTAVAGRPATAAPSDAPWPTAGRHTDGGHAVGAEADKAAEASPADAAKEAAANRLALIKERAEAEARQAADQEAAAAAKAGTQERQEAAAAAAVPAAEAGKAESTRPLPEAGQAETAERPDEATGRHLEQANNQPPMPAREAQPPAAEVRAPEAAPAQTGEDLEAPAASPTAPASQLAQAGTGAAAAGGVAPTKEVRAPEAAPAQTGEDLEEPEATSPTASASQLAQAGTGAAAAGGVAPANGTAVPPIPAASAPSQRRVSQIAKTAVPKMRLRKIAGLTASDRCETAGASVQLPGWYVVKKGDTLWAIAERHYGAGARYRRIYKANQGRLPRGPDWIVPCQHLYLPPQRRRA